MDLNPVTKERIESIVGSDKVVLFMKGTPAMPQCGFSAATIGILDALMPKYTTFNVLEDQEVREGVKSFSNWPTIPQLYIDNEFVGGCDIIKQMFNAGDLHDMLGVEPPDRTPPVIGFSDDAVELVTGALQGNPGMAVHLQIDARWQHNVTLGAAEGHEIRGVCDSVAIYMDVATAQKAKNLVIGIEDTLQGKAFTIDNPNAPPSVKQLSPAELKSQLDANDPLTLVDVRPEDERAKAQLAGSMPLDEAGMAHLDTLERATPLVFYCHLGQRSQAAAEHYRLQGFSQVFQFDWRR